MTALISLGRHLPKKTVERVMGIGPTSKAWEAFVLPLNYTRKHGTILWVSAACDNPDLRARGVRLLSLGRF